MIPNLALAKTLKPGDLITVVVYGGRLTPAIFKQFSKRGAFQFFRLYDEKFFLNHRRHCLTEERIYGSNISERVAKMNIQDLDASFLPHHNFIREQTKGYFNGA